MHTSNKKYILNNLILNKPSSHPDIWGPQLWNYIHISTAHFPEHPSSQESQEMLTWICTLPVTIPCETCRQHFRTYIGTHRSQLPYICGSRTDLFKFFVLYIHFLGATNICF